MKDSFGFKPGDLVVKLTDSAQWAWTVEGRNTLTQERLQAGVVVLLIHRKDSFNAAEGSIFDWECMTPAGLVGVVAIRHTSWEVVSA